MDVDLRSALNSLSDVVQNRPLPLREFDQIYMKIGDLAIHADFAARRFKNRHVVFVGDGDAVGLAMAHLIKEKIIREGPSKITILDFDERVVNSINRFSADLEYSSLIEAKLYNVIDAVPQELVGAFDAFHINPPWGQHNAGESVVIFLQRAMTLVRDGAIGITVIADDAALPWTNQVLHRTQSAALQNGFIVDEMVPTFHSYHLDDAPDLRSCAIVFRQASNSPLKNAPLTNNQLENFYGRTKNLRIRYVRENPEVGRGRASIESYHFEGI